MILLFLNDVLLDFRGPNGHKLIFKADTLRSLLTSFHWFGASALIPKPLY